VKKGAFFAVALIFIAARVAILAVRPPFFDELFTLWMARQPMSHIVPNLLHDSGPPLYYFIARFDSIVALRLLSLLFATIQFVLVARRSLLAGLLLALYPPAALFAVDARAYALCALFVTIGVLAVDSKRFLVAAFSFALAAHAHYYGVLFFPLLLLRGRWSSVVGRGGAPASGDTAPTTNDQRPTTPLGSFFLAILLFLPGFILATKQPVEAMKWNRESLFAPLTGLSFAGTYPYALFAGAPVAVALSALVVLIAALSRSMRFAPAVLVPLALVVAFHIAGRPVYFPMRFEAVISGPLTLWLGHSLFLWTPSWRRTFATPLAILGAVSIAIGVIDHERRPLDPYRQAALALQHHASSEPIVATGYCYLEAVTALNRPVVAWPAEQAQHPGWRSTKPADPRELPSIPFIWFGERSAPELTVLRGVKTVRPMFWNERALVADATDLTSPVH
jgi:hypothetical protein